MSVQAVYGDKYNLNRTVLEMINRYSKDDRVMIFDCDDVIDSNDLTLIEPYDVSNRLKNIFLINLDSYEKLCEYLDNFHNFKELNIKKVIFTSFFSFFRDKTEYKLYLHNFFANLQKYSQGNKVEFIVALSDEFPIGDFAEYIDKIEHYATFV